MIDTPGPGDGYADAGTAFTARRLRRRAAGRVVAGVAVGLGDYTGIDPIVFRVAFAVLSIFGGAGLILYAVGWVLVPLEGHPAWYDGMLDRRQGRFRVWLLALAVGVLILALASTLSLHRTRPGVLLAAAAFIAVVVAFGAARNNRQADRGAALSPDAAADADRSVPAVLRERSRLTLPTLGVAALVTISLAVLELTGVMSIPVADLLWCIFGVTLVGIVASTRQRFALGLVPVLVVLGIAATVTQVLPQGVTWSVGTRAWTPSDVSQIPASYNLGIGHETVDLTHLPESSQVTVHAVAGFGNLVIQVPPGSQVILHGHVAAGTINAFNRRVGGLSTDLSQVYPVSGPASGSVITLDLAAGYGEIDVQYPLTPRGR
jgi:phage shock protein PspC (stress-responsive transcriptional regulator)